MKKAFLLGLTTCVLALVGCKKSASCWYPIEGGYVNLDNVRTISTEAEIVLRDDDWNRLTVIDGAITKENINEAIRKVKNNKEKYSHIQYHATISFDGFDVKLPTMDDKKHFPNGWSSEKDIIKLLQLWLDAKTSVDSLI